MGYILGLFRVYGLELRVWGLGFRILGCLEHALRIYDSVDLCLLVDEFRGCTVGGLCLALGVYGSGRGV